jgi:hypothetical protein
MTHLSTSSAERTARPLPAIQADIATALAMLGALEQERRHSRAARRAGIVADFDAGLARTAIAARWGVPYNYVAAILYKARRTERTRRAHGLSLSQRADYQRLLRQGVRSRIARAIALRGP